MGQTTKLEAIGAVASAACGGRPDRGPVRKAPKSPAHYPIRAVSRLTGIGIDTLRAWSDVMVPVTPVRDERGRMYTDADVARLRLCAGPSSRDTASGASQGSLTPTCTASPRRREKSPPRQPIRCDRHHSIPPRSALRCTSHDAAGIDQEVARLAAVLRPLDLLRDALMPALVQVGDDWQSRTRRHCARALDVLDGTAHSRSFLRLYAQPDAEVRFSLPPPRASATRSARLVRRCSRQAAAWALRISGRTFPHGKLSGA